MVHQRVSTQSGHYGDHQPLLCAPCCSCCPFLSSAGCRRRPARAAVGHLQRPTAELPVAASQASSVSSSPSATISPSADSVSLPTPVAVQCQAGGPPSPPYYWHTSSPEELAPSASFPSAAASAAAPAPAPAHHSTAPSGRSSSPPPSALHDAASHVNLVGCSACEAPRHDDSDHVAFTLTAAGGRSLLLSHRETACVVAIMEVISRCSAPITASAAPSPEIQDADANQRRQLFDQQQNFK